VGGSPDIWFILEAAGGLARTRYLVRSDQISGRGSRQISGGAVTRYLGRYLDQIFVLESGGCAPDIPPQTQADYPLRGPDNPPLWSPDISPFGPDYLLALLTRYPPPPPPPPGWLAGWLPCLHTPQVPTRCHNIWKREGTGPALSFPQRPNDTRAT
jgi:hypothetical protein